MSEGVWAHGIVCPECGSESSIIVDTRRCAGTVRRRRQCPRGCRYTTNEVVVHSTHANTGLMSRAMKNAMKARVDERLQ